MVINSWYDNLIYKIEKPIKYYIEEIFNIYIYDRNSFANGIIDDILDYFDKYFFKSFIISNLRDKINQTVCLGVKENLFEFRKSINYNIYNSNKQLD